MWRYRGAALTQQTLVQLGRTPPVHPHRQGSNKRPLEKCQKLIGAALRRQNLQNWDDKMTANVIVRMQKVQLRKLLWEKIWRYCCISLKIYHITASLPALTTSRKQDIYVPLTSMRKYCGQLSCLSTPESKRMMEEAAPSYKGFSIKGKTSPGCLMAARKDWKNIKLGMKTLGLVVK